MDPKIRSGQAAAMTLLAATAIVAGAEAAKDLPTDRERPWWEKEGRGHGKGKLRKGTKPRPKKFFLVQEVPPGQVEMRQAAGQRLVRRPDGIWIWPVADQRRYQREHP